MVDVPEPLRDAKSENYFISFSYQGRRHKRSTGSSGLPATRRAQAIVDGKVAQLKVGLIQVPEGVGVAELIFDGKQQPDSERDPLSLPEFYRRYLREAVPPNKAESTFLTERIHLSHLQEFARTRGAADLRDLGRDFFEAYKRRRHRAGVRNITINKELGTFRTMLNVAVKSGLLARNPLVDVKWLKEDVTFERFKVGSEIEALLANGDYPEEAGARMRRFRYLEPAEVQRLLELAKGTLIYAFVATAAYTGMRFSEVARLTWPDVDFANKRILARGCKGSRRERESPRYIPLHPNLAAILQDQTESANGALVSGDEEGQARPKAFYYWQLKKLTDGTEFEGIRFHTLRHSFASNLAVQGVGQRLIDVWMGHQTEAMRKRYQHLFPDQQQEAIQQLDF